MAKTVGPIAGRSITPRLLVEAVDTVLVIVEKAVMTWVDGVWDGLVAKSVMEQAWRIACVDRMGGGNNRGARQGGAAALWDSLALLGWTAPAYDVFKVRDGHLLRFGGGCLEDGMHEADPSLIRKFITG